MKTFFAILLLTMLTGLTPSVRAEVAAGIKAVVHDSVITYLDVEDATAPVADELRRDFSNQPDVYDKRLTAALITKILTM